MKLIIDTSGDLISREALKISIENQIAYCDDRSKHQHDMGEVLRYTYTSYGLRLAHNYIDNAPILKAGQYDTGFEEGVKYGLMLQDSPWVSVKDELPDSSIKCWLTISSQIPDVPASILEVYPSIVNRIDDCWVTDLGIHIADACVIAWMKVPEPYNPENK